MHDMGKKKLWLKIKHGWLENPGTSRNVSWRFLCISMGFPYENGGFPYEKMEVSSAKIMEVPMVHGFQPMTTYVAQDRFAN